MKNLNVIDPRIDRRLEQHFKWRASKDLPPAHAKSSIAILSYPDDEGVRLNGGRPGANEGPARILQYLGRMVLSSETPEIVLISDAFSQLKLSDRHQAAEEAHERAYEKGFRVLSLGGGHDYAYPDGAAFYRKFRGKILNIDAHLDCRPVIDFKLNSGTGFSRLAEKFNGSMIVQWGTQAQCNAEAQVLWAKKRKMKIVPLGKPMPQIPGKVGLSICMDAFQGIRAVSAPAFLGLDALDGLKAIEKYKMRSPWLGLYESAPRYDSSNEDSARLAACFAYKFIHLKAGALK